MTLNEFITKWNGKKVDVDGVYGNQCTDLTKQWLKELGYDVSGAWGNGKDWDKNSSKDDLQWIANTPAGVPSEGDIMVFGGGSYGHVSIFIDGDTNSFRSFDQNWPSGKLEPCSIATHKYTGTLFVKGWLRPLKYHTQSTPTVIEKTVYIDRPVEVIRYIDKPVIQEVIKEIEKVVEVKVPVEIVKEIIKNVFVSERLPNDEQIVLDIYRKIKNYFRRSK